MLGLFVWSFCETPNSGTGCVSTLLPAPEIAFLLSGCPFQPRCEDFRLALLYPA